ncbi:Vinorine synthase [Spatholobus suberectus]|nr:Vinorine synthase [Spatholobus suberectus]
MGMEITIRSRETIKPSLPTPDDHRFFQLSLFDQLQLITYLPMVLFYPKKEGLSEPSHICAQLKRSLSETLTIFYPVAGRRKDHTFITCNDEGALYLEAKVNHNMVEFLTPPKLEFLNKLLHVSLIRCTQIEKPYPKYLYNLFQTTWAAICRGSREEVQCPDFNSASSFLPPVDHLSLHDHVDQNNEDSSAQKMCTTRRFVFIAESINTLRAEAKDDDDDESSKPPTRYETLAAFIWKHMTLACKKESRDSTRPALAIHIVNMRRRMGEPISKYTIGNILWPVMVFCETVNADTGVRYLVSIAREKFGKLSRELLLRVKSDPNILGSTQCVDLPQGIETRSPIPVVLTSWCGLNFSELDFGWGKPLWIGVRGGDQETLPNVAVIMETDAGMEAWLTMEMQHIANLEKDMEFLRLALPNPSVSNI